MPYLTFDEAAELAYFGAQVCVIFITTIYLVAKCTTFPSEFV